MRSGSPPNGIIAGLKWRFKVHWTVVLIRAASVLLGLLSLLIVWIEMTIFSENDLSGNIVILNSRYSNININQNIFTRSQCKRCYLAVVICLLVCLSI
jgi:hypothetical protein